MLNKWISTINGLGEVKPFFQITDQIIVISNTEMYKMYFRLTILGNRTCILIIVYNLFCICNMLWWSKLWNECEPHLSYHVFMLKMGRERKYNVHWQMRECCKIKLKGQGSFQLSETMYMSPQKACQANLYCFVLSLL